MTIFQNMSPQIQDVILKLLLLLVVLSVVVVLRRVIRAMIFRPLKRLLNRRGSKLGSVIYDSIERSARLLVFAVAILLAVTLFEFGDGTELLAGMVARVLLLMAAFIATYSVVEIVFSNVSTVQNVLGIYLEERLIPFLRVIIQVTVVLVGLLVVLQEFGVDITALLASFGVVGLALSLAAQDTAANIFSFAAIISDNPFKVGDYISNEAYAGTIEHVGVRSTRIRKLDQTLVIVPNNLITSVPIINASRMYKRRLDFYVRFEYYTTSNQIRAAVQAIREMLRARPYTEPNSVVVHFVTFSDNSLDVRVIANIMLPDWNAFTAEKEEVNLQVLDIVATLKIKAGRQNLYIENLPEYEETSPMTQTVEELTRKTQRLRAVQARRPHEAATSVPRSEVPDQADDSDASDSNPNR